MSLELIEQAIEKVAFLPAGSGAVLKGAFSKGSTWKGIGTRAAIGAGVGGVGNVLLGDKDQSVMERATKGAVGGGLVGGLYGAGRAAHGAIRGDAVGKVRSAVRQNRFVNNDQIHGTMGNRNADQLARYQSDLKAHKATIRAKMNPSATPAPAAAP